MKKLIVFDEQEFKDKFIEFCNEFIEFSEKPYGVSLVSNETGEKVTDRNTIYGSLYIQWNNTFGSKKSKDKKERDEQECTKVKSICEDFLKDHEFSHIHYVTEWEGDSDDNEG